ncbi:MAG: 50S ribosomal protein L15 [Fimbriimonadaceae bacterium]|nr:50S ribosomal protein L15 [Fimbriimonadaceae bacterium]
MGRGIGSKRGKTATRGSKGQKARRQISPWFEGGQTPIHRRLPVKKGFRNINHKEFAVVNISSLDAAFEDGASITPEELLARKVISSLKDGVKILGYGETTKKLSLKVHRISGSGREKIEKAGGSVELIEA